MTIQLPTTKSPLRSRLFSALAAAAVLAASSFAGAQEAPSAVRAAYNGPVPSANEVVNKSDFLYFKDTEGSAILPKGAILHVPSNHHEAVVSAPQNGIKLWTAFLTRNIGRVVTLEVTTEQAAGLAPIEASKIEAAIATGRIVVAVTDGNPTSVKAFEPALASNNQ